MTVIYDSTKMDFVRNKTKRLNPATEKASGKRVMTACLTHGFECHVPDQTITIGKAGDFLVDEVTTWKAVPQAEYAAGYMTTE